MDKRVISALVAIPILIFFVLSGGILFKIGVIAISGIAVYEYINVYKNSGNKVIGWLLILGYIFNSILLLTNKYGSYSLPLIYLTVMLCMAVPIFTRKYNVISSAVTITGFLYIIPFFSFLVLIDEGTNGSSLIWLVFITAFACDTFAYYIGKTFGKIKLCPEVSPKKTVAGLIGGIFGSIIGLVLWGLFNKNLGIPIYELILLGIAGGAVAQIGDLSASLIKRFAGIKDYGNIMPGHGGILDRFDSILFTAPVVYYYIVLFLR